MKGEGWQVEGADRSSPSTVHAPPSTRDGPLNGPYPPTPRAEAFARKAWAWCRRKHLNRWTAGQWRIFHRIWLEEVTAAARARKDRS